MAKIFGENVVRQLAAEVEFINLEQAVSTVSAWLQDYKTGSLRTDSETSREQAFNQDFFVSILGYQEKPRRPFTLQPKSSTDSGEIPDARLCFVDEEENVEHTYAVVELKGAKTSLDKPQRGHANQTPVQQAFKYKPQYRGCEFVIVSNYFEIRLYNDNLLDFESWNLEDLADPTDDYINLRVFHFLLNQKNFAPSNGVSNTSSLLLEARSKQQEITKKFYLDYRLTRLNLVSHLLEGNPQLKSQPHKVVHFAQKLIDRIVFVCFAEDRGFIPDHSLAQVVAEVERSSFSTMWTVVKSFFEAIDLGSQKLGIANGFNGGLFQHDPELDSLLVDDAALKRLLQLGEYDFSNDLSVTVLGHIFEQSITDIEELKSDLEDGKLGSLNASSTRKMSGVYYTPDHVVRGIVANSLGKYLSGIEAELLAEFGLKEDIRQETFDKRQRQAYLRYQEKLQNIRVLDPACGSGAFLVAALDYLLSENRRVASVLGPDLLGSEEFLKKILQKNLFGVDINEESVEITKLSLWLKSAVKGQKLTNLDNSIRCGDSLVQDAEFTARPLSWIDDFGEVLDDGGFDVVIGNPPYVDSELMVKATPIQRSYISDNYRSASGNWDLFVPFVEKGLELTRDGGFCSMIIPNKSLISDYAAELRRLIVEVGAVHSVADLMTESVFDVDVYPVVLTIEKGVPQGKVNVFSGGFGVSEEKELDTERWFQLLGDSASYAGKYEVLSDHFVVSAAATVGESYQLRESIAEDPAASDYRVVNTGTIDPFLNFWGLDPMRYIKGNFLHPVGPKASQTKKSWFEKPAVVVAGMATEIEACFMDAGAYLPAKSTVVITGKEGSSLSEYAALALLNTQIFSDLFVSDNKLNSMAGGYITINQRNLSKARFPDVVLGHSDRLDAIGRIEKECAEQIMSLSRRLRNLLLSHHEHADWPKSLRYWWLLDFPSFSRALGVELSLFEREDLMNTYDKYVGEATALWSQILECNDEANSLLGDPTI